MTRKKRLAFALLTLALLIAAIEGSARIVWWQLARKAFAAAENRGKEMLAADTSTIHFMEVPHPLYTYTLKPGFETDHLVVNMQGFAQRETVPLARSSGTLRLAAMGESTTHGHDVDKGCYPTYLRQIIAASGNGCSGVEMINGGVAGWISDQVALRAEHQVAAYRPDIVVLYTGWNDFQGYDPRGPAPQLSAFCTYHGGSQWHRAAVYRFKTVALLSALYQKYCCEQGPGEVPILSQNVPREELYKFYLQSLDRMVAAFRRANPQVQVALCTLVGKWPLDTPEDFVRPDGRTWWMKHHSLTRQDAADYLRQFDDLIKQYATDHGLVLIDAAAAFESLDRSRLQSDFCHMTFEGYELLAETMYETLRQAHVIQGSERPRRAELLAKYKLADTVAHRSP
jgi:lysophospholipase L1-like esterase